MDNVRPLLGTIPPEPALIDHHGREAHLYSFSFNYADAEYSFSLWAYSGRDAKRRLRAIRRGLRLDGRLYAKGGGIPTTGAPTK